MNSNDDKRIENLLATLVEGQKSQQKACEAISKMVEYVLSRDGSVHLDNTHSTDFSQHDGNAMKEDYFMADHRKLRVQIDTDDIGKPVVKQVYGKTELELSDKVIMAVIKSGRIWSMLADVGITCAGPEFTKMVLDGHDGALVSQAKHNFADYARHWRSVYKSGLEVTTENFVDSKVNVLLRYFGSMDIEDITSDDVQNFATERAEEVCRQTLKQDLWALRSILDSAIDDGYIHKNPARDRRIKNKAKKGKGTKSLTVEQAKTVKQAIPNLQMEDERLLISLLVYTSFRREEILGLRWEQVDFDARVIHVNHATVYVKGKPHTKDTKTEAGEREFPMGDDLYAILKPLAKDSGYLFPGRDGKPITQSPYRRLWMRLSAHMELYGMTARNFRTTFATMAGAAGVDIRTVQALMGHADPLITLKTYMKEEKSQLPIAVEQISGFLQDSGQ